MVLQKALALAPLDVAIRDGTALLRCVVTHGPHSEAHPVATGRHSDFLVVIGSHSR